MSYVADLKKYPEDHFFYKEAMRKGDLFEDVYVIDGIVRWKSNNSVPPTELLELWQYLNKDFSFEKSLKQQDIENSNFLKQYREQQANRSYSEEELFEMRSAFGTGTKVVDVITGKTIEL